MKKILLSLIVFFAASVAQAAVGDDLTQKYLRNADFSQGATVGGYVCTYDYDMEGKAATMYGQQAVDGWNAPTLTDNTLVPNRTDGLNARAGGLYAIPGGEGEGGAIEKLGGEFIAPANTSTGATSGQVLGLVAVWGAKMQYTQEVTLPAGAYTLKFMINNMAGATAVAANLFGFLADNGTAYTCDNLTWTESTALEMAWEENTVTFLLEETTSGVISVGYTAAGAGSAAMPHLFVESVKVVEADPAVIIKERIDALKESDLLPLLNQGDELGVDTQAGWAVYNNESATMEEVLQAIATQKENNERGMTDFTDIFINNAHFAEGTPLDAGVCTYQKDMESNGTHYYGMQPVAKWTASNPEQDARASGLFAVGSPEEVWLGSKGDVVPITKANGATTGNLFGFISVWSASSYYYQNATLPAGSYTITIPTYNERGTGAVTKNLCGFVTDDGEEYLAETTTFPVGQWTNEVIKFSLSEETSGHFSIGYEAANAGSGSMPHLFVDEFTLMYNGVINNPSLIALQGAVRNAANYTESEERYEEAIRERLQTAAENGQSLLSAASADETANVAAVTAINSAIDEAMASMAVYQKFLAFIEGDLAAAIDKYGDNEVMEYFDEDLNDTRDTYMTAYEDGSYTTQQINEAIAALKPAVLAAVQSALAAAAADGEAHDIDISLLFDNISFMNQSTAGWTATHTSGKFESQVSGVCEVWSNAAVDFTASTTLNGLPAGAYEVSAPGWFRDAGDMNVGYDHYTSGEIVGAAYIFANGNKTVLLNQADERLLADAEDDMHNGALSDGQYLPNGQACAQQVFYNSDIDVTNTVTTALLEAGDLTIGFTGAGLQSGTWTVWGAMSVKYKGNTDDLILTAMNEEISALIDEAVTTGMIDEVGYVNQACTQLDDATEKGDDALTVDDRATKTAAIAALREAIAYAKESGNTYVALGEKFTLYSEYLMPDVEGESQRFEDLLQDIGGGIDDGFESKEQMEQMMADLSTLFTDYVMGPVRDGASEAEPADITAAILNPSFEGILNPNNQKEYWTASKDGGNEGYQAGIYEFYGNNSFDIHQTITGLSEGYYRVRVQSFYRPGNNQDVADSLSTCGTDYGRYAVLYANELQQALKNPLERADEDGNLSTDILAGEGSEVAVKWGDVEQFYVPNDRTALAHYFEADIYWNTLDVKVGADGVLTIGLRKSQSVAGDWCPFDNFQLYYLGTTAPTAVESIADDTERTAQNSSWFDLQGRRVLRPTHGVYIRDGKKVLK